MLRRLQQACFLPLTRMILVICSSWSLLRSSFGYIFLKTILIETRHGLSPSILIQCGVLLHNFVSLLFAYISSLSFWCSDSFGGQSEIMLRRLQQACFLACLRNILMKCSSWSQLRSSSSSASASGAFWSKRYIGFPHQFWYSVVLRRLQQACFLP